MDLILGSLAGSLGTGIFNAEQADKQMRFQKKMSDTAYQRSARDLEKAGLNRVLALGSPASSPAGAMGTMPDLGQTAIGSSSAKSVIAKQKEEAKLLVEQQALVGDQRYQARTQGDANVANAAQARANEAYYKELKNKIPAEIQSLQAEAANKLAQIPNMDALARINEAEAAQQEMLKALAIAVGPSITRLAETAAGGLQKILDRMMPENSAKANSSWSDDVKTIFEHWSPAFRPGGLKDFKHKMGIK